MVARAVSARDWLTPLAILVPIGATPPLALWALSVDPITVGPVLALLVLAGGTTAVVVAGRRTYGVRICVLTAILTWLAAVFASPFLYGFEIDTPACGKIQAGASALLPATIGALVFLAAGSWGLRTHRALYVVPLAAVLGLFVLVAVYAVLPGTNVGCET
jgi:hypothetical protein